MASISLTSMMDVTFNLLIAFMIVAPTLKHGIEIDLPRESAANLKPKEPLSVVIRKAPEEGEEERIYIDDERVSLDELSEKMTALYQRNTDMDVMLEADRIVSYEIVAKVLNALQQAGVDDVGLVTEPPAR